MSTELTPSMRRSVLISALRNPDTWPEGFEWDFRYCKSCAMGMVRRLFPDQVTWDGPSPTEYIIEAAKIGRLLGIGVELSCSLFIDTRGPCGAISGVTPEVIAYRLEKLHKKLVEQGK